MYMAENLEISNGNKAEKYKLLHSQIVAVCSGEDDVIANMANIASMIHETFNFWWTGFYRIVSDELILGPFQGPLACTRIKKGKGVCGTAWEKGGTIVVPDVDKFPGHIACSSASKSEIVVPVFSESSIVAILDIDSENYNTFDDIDRCWLERIVKIFEAE